MKCSQLLLPSQSCKTQKMEEDVSELLGTEERMEKFANEYVKLPVLWYKHDLDHKNKSARIGALRQLARALGRGGADSGRRMARVVERFRYRLKLEVMSACAEASLREGVEGGDGEAARALLPAWARRAAACLPSLPAGLAPQENTATPAQAAAPTKSSKKTKPSGSAVVEQTDGACRSPLVWRVVRGVRRAARAGGALGLGGRAGVARVARQLGEDSATVHNLWTSMQRSCLHKLRARVWRCDTGPPLSAVEWAVIDLVVTYGSSMLNMLHYQHYKPLRGLLGVFHLVQRFGLEPLPGEPPPSPALWRQAAAWYSRDQGRAVMSAVVLQRRWYDLRVDTRRRLQAAWRHRARDAGGGGEGETAPPAGRGGGGEPDQFGRGGEELDARVKVLALHEAIARRYPHVVTETLPTWSYMQQTNQIAPPTNERGPVPGETAHTGEYTDSDADTPEDDGVIVIEDEKQKILNADETNARKSDSIVEKPKDLKVGDFVITDSDDNDDLKLQINAEPVHSGSLNANFEFTDSDGDLQIDESRDRSENVIEALQKLNPRAVQATIVFASDEEDAPSDVSEAKRTDNIKTENVKPERSKIKANVKRESAKEDADTSSKNKSCVKTGNSCNDVYESHKSISLKPVKRRSDSSDSDDGILVIDDCKKDESDDLENKDRIIASIEEEMFKDTSNGSSSRDEVKSRVDNSAVKLPSEQDSNSKTSLPPHQNPILSQMLTSKQDDVFKRCQAFANKAKDNQFSSLTAESVAKRDINAVAMTSKINEYAMKIKNELCEQSVSASEEENDFEGGIDPKLLIYPVVLLTRIDERLKPPPENPKPKISASQTVKLSPKLLANKNHIEALSTLSEAFFSIKRNIEQLKECKPCAVMLARLEETEGKRSRVSKRVELPDIEEVRRNNKKMLTAQVAPLAHQKCAGATRGAEATVSLEELQRMLDDFVGASPAHADCKYRNSDAGSAGSCDCGHGSCLSRALAAPPDNTAARQLQTRLLLRAASHAKRHPKISSGKDQNRKRKKKRERSPSPLPVRRSPSPYDAERAAREWLREKNVAAEKFGVKPRCFKKKPSGALDAATITPLPAPALAPRPCLARPEPFPDRATITLTKHILNKDIQKQNTSASDLGRPPPEPRRSVEAPSGVTVAPVRAENGLAYLPLSEKNLNRPAQNQPIFKITPDLFNVHAVADINKKLEDWASNDRTDGKTEETFSPIITGVHSLAPMERSAGTDGQQFCWLSKRRPADGGVPSRLESRPVLTLTGGRIRPQNVPKIVINKSQLKALPAQPPAPGARSLLKTQQTPGASDAPPRADPVSDSTINTAPWHVKPGTSPARDGKVSKTPNQTNVVLTNSFLQAQPGLQLNSVYSGPPLAGALQTAPWIVTSVQPATPAIVVGPPSTISRSTFENLPKPCGLNMNPNALQLHAVQARPPQAPPGLSGVQVGSHLQLVLTPQQITSLQPGQQIAVVQGGQQVPAVQLNWDANALQVNSVRSAPAKTAPPTDATPTNQQVGPAAAVRVNSVPAGPPHTSSSKRPQPRKLLPSDKLSDLKPSPRVSVPQPSPVPAAPLVTVPKIVVLPGPSADKRKTTEHADEVFNESDWPGLPAPSAVDARAWVAGPAGRDRSRLAVLAAAPGCWRVARHLVLSEARALPARPAHAVYALRPLQRLLIPDDDEPSGPTQPKQAKGSEQPAAPRPWLKVKAFAKMTDAAAAAAAPQIDPQSSPKTYPGCRETIRQALLKKSFSSDAIVIILASLTPYTFKRYDCSLKKWFNYCQKHKYDYLKPTVLIVINFLLETFKGGAKYSTMYMHKCAITTILQPNVEETDIIKRFMKRIFRHKAAPRPKYNLTWDPSIVLNYLSQLWPHSELSLEMLSKKTLTLLALVTAHSVQTFSIIKLNNIQIHQDSEVIISIPDLIKTSTRHCTQPILRLPYFDIRPEICPARSLISYIEKTSIHRPNNSQILFISSRSPFNKVGPITLNTWIKDIFQLSGLNVSRFTAHSPRHAATSGAGRMGVSLEIIRETAGWTTESKVFAKFYNRQPGDHTYHP